MASTARRPTSQGQVRQAVLRDEWAVAEFLTRHVFGKIVPDEIAARIDLDGLQPAPTQQGSWAKHDTGPSGACSQYEWPEYHKPGGGVKKRIH